MYKVLWPNPNSFNPNPNPNPLDFNNPKTYQSLWNQSYLRAHQISRPKFLVYNPIIESNQSARMLESKAFLDENLNLGNNKKIKFVRFVRFVICMQTFDSVWLGLEFGQHVVSGLFGKDTAGKHSLLEWISIYDELDNSLSISSSHQTKPRRWSLRKNCQP